MSLWRVAQRFVGARFEDIGKQPREFASFREILILRDAEVEIVVLGSISDTVAAKKLTVCLQKGSRAYSDACTVYSKVVEHRNHVSAFRASTCI